MWNTIRTNTALAREIAKLEAEKAQLKLERVQSDLDLTAMRDKAVRLEQSLSSAEKEQNELGKLVREQTAADLLVNALEAVGIIPNDKGFLTHKAEHNRLASIYRQNNAIRQTAGLSGAAAANPYGLGGLLGQRGGLGGWS